MDAENTVAYAMEHIVQHLKHRPQITEAGCVKACLQMLNTARPGGPDLMLHGVLEQFPEPTHQHLFHALFASVGFGLGQTGCAADPHWTPEVGDEYLYLMVSSRARGHALLLSISENRCARVWDPASAGMQVLEEKEFFRRYPEPFLAAYLVSFFPRNY